jgi:hypothetical protein
MKKDLKLLKLSGITNVVIFSIIVFYIIIVKLQMVSDPTSGAYWTIIPLLSIGLPIALLSWFVGSIISSYYLRNNKDNQLKYLLMNQVNSVFLIFIVVIFLNS